MIYHIVTFVVQMKKEADILYIVGTLNIFVVVLFGEQLVTRK